MKFDWTLESLPMVLELIDQVLALHPGIDWFHIGGDEVRNMFEKWSYCSENEYRFQPNLIHYWFPLSVNSTDE